MKHNNSLPTLKLLVLFIIIFFNSPMFRCNYLQAAQHLHDMIIPLKCTRCHHYVQRFSWVTPRTPFGGFGAYVLASSTQLCETLPKCEIVEFKFNWHTYLLSKNPYFKHCLHVTLLPITWYQITNPPTPSQLIFSTSAPMGGFARDYGMYLA